MYLPVDVYKNTDGYDCSLNGVTNQNLKLVVPCPNGHITQEQVDEHGYTVLVVGEAGGVKHFKPVTKKWTMFGGNFVYTSDSRFRELYGNAPVKVHDRIED